MNFETSSQFDKQVFKIKDKALKNRIKTIIGKVAEAQSFDQIPNVLPIIGHPGYYRIRFGDFRLGISLEENTVWFLYFGKRNENTYKKFP